VEQDKKIFNWVLIIALFVFPVVGMIFLDAPEGVEGSDALFFSAAIGLCVFRFVRPPVPVSSGQAFRCDPASMI